MNTLTNSPRFDLSRIKVENEVDHDLLEAFVSEYDLAALKVSERSGDCEELVISATRNGIEVVWKRVSTRPLKYFIDVQKFVTQQKTFPAPKQGAFNQALGRKSRQIVDATGGWGADALLMCSQGYHVSLIERHPLMALLLKDAMQRLARTDWANSHEVVVPKVVEGDAVGILASGVLSADCVYLDPMFPAKRKKSAAVNKNMQLLQRLVGADFDADLLLQAVIDSAYARVAVKRPDYAQPLSAQIDGREVTPFSQFSSKLVHYDVYLKSAYS